MNKFKSAAAWATFPVILTGQIVVFERSLSLGFDPALTLLAITVVNMGLIAMLELWLPDRPEWLWTRDGQVVNDIVHGIGNVFGENLGRSALLIFFAVVGGKLAAEGNLGLWPSDWPLWGQVLLAVAIVDFCDYWKHRAYHGWAFAWPVHALHHNMDRMHVFKGIRLHFLEATVRSLIVYGPLAMLGASMEVMLWIAALMTFGGSLNHSNLMQKLPRIVHAALVTQKTHWLHHNKDDSRGACNFSPLTMLCDHLFGTFRHPLDEPLHEVGIVPDPIPSNIPAQLASPFLWPLLMWRNTRRERANREAMSKAAKVASLLVVAAFAGVSLNEAQAEPRPDIAGRWATQGLGSIVEFAPCAQAAETMCGRILWLWEANDSSGAQRTDRNNPDRALANRPLIGIEIIRGLRETAPGVWTDGAVYNPDDGRTYSGEIRFKDGSLELRGCALVIFCQTQTWHRPEDVIAAIKAVD